MHMAFRQWAVPEKMRIDNGKDFVSKTLTGVPKHVRDALRRTYGHDFWAVLERDKNLVDASADPRWKGVTGELGIELVFAHPYSPWAKGTIERWFGGPT